MLCVGLGWLASCRAGRLGKNLAWLGLSCFTSPYVPYLMYPASPYDIITSRYHSTPSMIADPINVPSRLHRHSAHRLHVYSTSNSDLRLSIHMRADLSELRLDDESLWACPYIHIWCLCSIVERRQFIYDSETTSTDYDGYSYSYGYGYG